MEINSREYWEDKFASGRWKQLRCHHYNIDFYRYAVELAPWWLVEEIRSEAMSICDVCSAEGHGLPVLRAAFPENPLFGMDFSSSAIAHARAQFPDYTFIVDDFMHTTHQYDVVFCSNTLEHFVDYEAAMRKMAGMAKRYLLLLVPFEEAKLKGEHVVLFNSESFEHSLSGCSLVFNAMTDTTLYAEQQLWPGRQMLLVYQRQE